MQNSFLRFQCAVLAAALALSLCACAGTGAAGKAARSASERPSATSDVRVAVSSEAKSLLAAAQAPGDGAAAQTLMPRLGTSGRRPRPDAVPDFLTADQKSLYDAAYVLYYYFDMTAGFDLTGDATVRGPNGWTYMLDRGYDTYDDFVRALDAVFTPAYAQKLLSQDPLYLKGDDGRLYCCGADRGSDIDYKSSTFALVSQTASRIEFDVVGHYDSSAYMDAKSAAAPYETNHRIVLEKTENGWRFSLFELAN